MNPPIYIHLLPDESLHDLHGSGPFRAVLVIEADVDERWRNTVAEWLVRNGCLYVMAWGSDCSTWHDCVDLANLRAFDFAEIPENAFVMTTWHADEPLAQVFWFSENAARHPVLSLEQGYIIHIAMSERRDEMLETYLSARELGDAPV